MNETIDRLKTRFAGEAADGVARIEAWMNALQESGDLAMADRIREEAHSLKGAAAVLDFEDFRNRAAALEDYAASLSASRDWPPDAVSRLTTLVEDARENMPVAA